MLDIEHIVEVALRAAQAGPLVECSERSSFHCCRHLRRPFPLFGRDGNHWAAVAVVGDVEVAASSVEVAAGTSLPRGLNDDDAG